MRTRTNRVWREKQLYAVAVAWEFDREVSHSVYTCKLWANCVICFKIPGHVTNEYCLSEILKKHCSRAAEGVLPAVFHCQRQIICCRDRAILCVECVFHTVTR
jgi:hypothetical protein